MSDLYTPQPEHKFSFGLWTVGNRGPRPVRRRRCATRCRRSTRWRCWRKSARGASTCTTTTSCRSTPPRRARSHRQGVRGRLPPARPRRADGDRQPVLRSGVSRRRVHRERRRRPRLRPAEDDARDGSRRRAGRRIFVLWGGREGTETDACRRPDEAIKRLREAVNYLCEYSIDREVRLQVRARGQAERAARRHLHGDDRRLSRLHPDARSSRDGRREPGSRARADGGAELPPRGRAGVGSGQAVPHRPERSGCPAATTRTSGSDPRTSRRRSGW